jgi:predicted TIM-barrel fold metal-dependent hydrolase
MTKSKLVLRPPKPHSGAPGASHFSGAFDPRNAQWRALLREDIIDPAEPLIDAHHHLWNKPGQPYLLNEYLTDANTGHNIRASVFVECGAYYRRHGPEFMNRLGEVEFANGIAAMAEGTAGNAVLVANAIVGTADLTIGAEIGQLLDAQIAAAGGRFKGVRLITKWDADETLNNGRYVIPRDLLSDHDFRAGFAELGRRGLSFDAMIYHPQLPEVLALARAFPESRIVLNHIGGLIAATSTYRGRHAEAVEDWKRGMSALASCPNVYVKLGGLGMSYLGYGLEKLETPAPSAQLAEVWGPYFHYCIDTFGPARCMFESNFPPDRESVDFPIVWNAFKRVASAYTTQERQALLFDTAARFYRMQLVTPD